MLTFIPNFAASNFFVIGAGGTGSRLVPKLAQFMQSVKGRFTPDYTIHLIDDDIVEEKNLVRQNFIAKDVGRPKAVVLSERYGSHFKSKIVPFVKRVGAPGGIERYSDFGLQPVDSIVIMAVDNVEARRKIIKLFNQMCAESGCRVFYIDAGNEGEFGQVRIFTSTQYVLPNSDEKGYKAVKDIKGKLISGILSERVSQIVAEFSMEPSMSSIPETVIQSLAEEAFKPSLEEYVEDRGGMIEVDSIPLPAYYYEDLKDHPGASCADLDQTLAINDLMSSVILGAVQRFTYCQPFNYAVQNFALSGDNYTIRNNLITAINSGINSSRASIFPGVKQDLAVIVREKLNEKLGSEEAMEKARDHVKEACSNSEEIKALIKEAEQAEFNKLITKVESFKVDFQNVIISKFRVTAKAALPMLDAVIDYLNKDGITFEEAQLATCVIGHCANVFDYHENYHYIYAENMLTSLKVTQNVLRDIEMLKPLNEEDFDKYFESMSDDVFVNFREDVNCLESFGVTDEEWASLKP